jgi:nicotinamide-nucleotide amidase
MQTVNAEIVAVGTEILLGEITDTNSVYIARELRNIGVNLFFMTSVGDNEGRIADAIRIALSRADVVIVCGGLGPTVDDMTRQGIADAVGRPLLYHEDLFEQILTRFASFRAQVTENNKRQAFLPQDALVINNPVGTAPGFIVEEGSKAIISVPGVPREMKYLMQESVIPYLHQKYALGIIKARNLKVAGIGESALDDMIGDELLNLSNPSIGLAAHHGVIDVRLTAKADDEAAADAMIDELETKVMARIGSYVYGKDEAELETVLLDELRTHGVKLTALEAGLSDAVVSKLQAANGGDALVNVRQYATPQEAFVAFPEITSANWREFAALLAQNLAQEEGVEAAIVILSDPDVGENADNREATAVAIYSSVRAQSRVYGFGAKADLTREWVSRWAMSVIWRMMKEKFDGMA